MPFLMGRGTVLVYKEAGCDFCKEDGIDKPALVDGKTRLGPWANMCQTHFIEVGIGLGTGMGQLLISLDTLARLAQKLDPDQKEMLKEKLG